LCPACGARFSTGAAAVERRKVITVVSANIEAADRRQAPRPRIRRALMPVRDDPLHARYGRSRLVLRVLEGLADTIAVGRGGEVSDGGRLAAAGRRSPGSG